MMKSILLTTGLLLMTALSGCSAGSDNAANAETLTAVTSSLPVLSGDNIWSVDRSLSKLQFIAEHNGDKFTGSFGTFDAAIKLDLDNPEGGEIHAVIDLSSVDAKDDDRNANLPSKAWFDVKSFPLATYSSNDIKSSPNGGYIANGELSLKGMKQPVTLNFSVETTGDTAIASGTARFSRTDFSIGTGSDFETEEWVKFPVEVLVSMTATR